MRVSPRSAVLLLMTSAGVLRSRMCRFDFEVEGELLQKLGGALSEAFVGLPLTGVGLPQVQGLLVSLGEYGLSCAPALTAFYELVHEAAEADVMLSGQLNLLRHPDYQLDRARSLLDFLARRELLVDMLAAHPGGLRVVLGNESHRPGAGRLQHHRDPLSAGGRGGRLHRYHRSLANGLRRGDSAAGVYRQNRGPSADGDAGQYGS